MMAVLWLRLNDSGPVVISHQLLHSSNELGELLQLWCYVDSNISIVVLLLYGHMA